MTAAPEALAPAVLPRRPRPVRGYASGKEDYLRHCVTAAAAGSPDRGDARLAEVTATIRQVIRL